MTRILDVIDSPSAFCTYLETSVRAFDTKGLKDKNPDPFSTVRQWAARVAPGTPSAPSPRRSSFYGTPKSAPFANNPPFTPSPKPVSPLDLLAQGYTQFIVPLPPLRTASDFHEKRDSDALLPLPRVRPRTKSLANVEHKEGKQNRLRSSSFRKAAPHVITENMPPLPPLPSSKHASRKPKSTPQSRYGAILAPGGGAGGLPLEQEVALSQMMGGGSHAKNVQRVVERHARETGLSASKGISAKDDVFYGAKAKRSGEKDRRPVEKREMLDAGTGGVGVVYRDQRGGLWWYESLLLPRKRRLILSVL